MNPREKVGLVFFGLVAVVSAILLFVPAVQQAEAAGRYTTGLGIPLWVLIALALVSSLAIIATWFIKNPGRRK